MEDGKERQEEQGPRWPKQPAGTGGTGIDREPQQDDDATDIQIVHVTVGPREFIGEMDMLIYPNYPNGELRLHNAVMVLYQDVGEEGKKVKTLLLNLQEKFRYTGEVILYPGEANMVLIMPLDEKGGLYKDYKKVFSVIIEPKGDNIIPRPGAKLPFPFGN